MRRHLALQDLSRDHHAILIHARRLRGEEPTINAETAGRRFLLFNDAVLRHHFAEEELALTGFIADADQRRRLAQEHSGLLQEAVRLSQASGPERDALQRALGWRLRDHVRFEEDELFPALQRDLNDEQWAQLTATAGAHRSSTRPTSIGPRAAENCFLNAERRPF